MKQLISIFFITAVLFSCSKDEPQTRLSLPEIPTPEVSEPEEPEIPVGQIVSNFDCLDVELEIIKDERCCDIQPNVFICEILNAEGINKIDENNYSWLPNACSELNAEIIFESSIGETAFKLLDRKHNILHEAVPLSCNGNYEKTTYVIQKNEIIELGFLNEKFGSDTIYLELRSLIVEYDDQTPAPKIDRFSILHRRSNTNIANFYHRHSIGDVDFDSYARTYHDTIELNGKVYSSVVEFKVLENVHAVPHTRLYINNELGFFGFEVDNITWTKK